MTEKIYYADSHRREFDATVTACETGKNGWQIALDRTAFFPEGGGQYADTGYLGEIRVHDVQEKDGVIWHMTEEALVVGAAVHGRIDWEKRFENMQQHTGEHIISGLVHGRFGYNNVGFHLGADYCTMDFDGPISKEELRELELEANRAVWHDLEVEVLYPSKEELQELDYRSKIEIEGQVRIIRIPGVDVCACCAPHMERTGEIGCIKLVNMINYKGGERVFMLCGSRALRDYQIKEENAKAISNLLCVKEPEIALAVEHLKEEQLSLKSRAAGLQQKLLWYRAEETDVSGDLVCVFDGELSGNAPRELMNLLLARGACVCAVFAGTDEDGYRYVIGSRKTDVRALCNKLNGAFDGRGGGKPEMAQGSLTGRKEEIEAFIKAGDAV